ncbi:UDP-glucuronate 4-epimerase [Parabacteroides sp. PF5-5]|uniref:NAD-dependent epimerase/dehydratase family protein n=1 Tax=unclassified Parabacteroides TaxID=2649774 RepID=UPI002473EF58|nr:MULTISPECIES: NAD-dependent epimerase/dehydratase family protein [unclassified Parabacteroides]MDH6304103.1 UDP-glucuronate 4-epimerase [Parabacteroides sp. PH5-39]MDH6315197.1 UDP-glucuronate 4-epimerase [Parabacteroides sp. PF5-13]MDH6318842.1 UDP-glucuronate 4-epimerase [Parabacteroides sp. PH5-13]MDH6322571.1 UDP-glucuronate 4-epimerase [Parabacteroides sp. PH5-8]MDH6326277.1 UDP-glucuronate 4-epimerase [Parabacteroides sp. PH5-41]
MRILVTGSAGFIGFHLVKKLLLRDDTEIVGIDNISSYYDVNLKYARLQESGISKDDISPDKATVSSLHPNYCFYQIDISDYERLYRLFSEYNFDYVINMAAQAGVRYSIDHPGEYIQSNVVGFMNILECCRHHKVKHLVYASSSSVYGNSKQVPFSEQDNTDYPASLYAATKKSNELLAHSYSHLFQLPSTGVRLFTVYGPWGRPDMAPILFAKAIYEDQPIRVFNHGDLSRDFTYIDDIVNGIIGLLPQAPGKKTEHPYYQVFNIGNSKPVHLMDFIAILEQSIGKKAVCQMLPMQAGDLHITYADTSRLQEYIQYAPKVSIQEGIPLFIDWFNDYMMK